MKKIIKWLMVKRDSKKLEACPYCGKKKRKIHFSSIDYSIACDKCFSNSSNEVFYETLKDIKDLIRERYSKINDMKERNFSYIIDYPVFSASLCGECGETVSHNHKECPNCKSVFI